MLYLPKPTILNITSVLFILGCLVYGLANFDALTREEGWGMLAILVMMGMGTLALLADFIIQKLFTNRIVVQVLGAVVAAVLGILIFFPHGFR